MTRYFVVLCVLNVAVMRADLLGAPSGDHHGWLLWRALAIPVGLGILWYAHRWPDDHLTQRLARAGLLAACGLCALSLVADLPHLLPSFFS